MKNISQLGLLFPTYKKKFQTTNQLYNTHRIHGAGIYANIDPINIPQMLAYIPYIDPMGYII